MQCWQCETPVRRAEIDFEAVLVPRSAGQGGPVLLHRCRACEVESLVERNGAGETLLSPPLVAGVRGRTLRGRVHYRAKKWMADHLLEREAFLARQEPERPSMPEPEFGKPEPPPPIEPEGDPAPDPEPDADSEPDDDPGDLSDAVTIMQAYEVLGLPLTATRDQIHKRYRELSKKSHPDRVADMDDEIRRAADRRFRQIRKAYDLLEGQA